VRWNQQFFNSLRDEDDGDYYKWGSDASRIDFAVGYRFTEYLQVKIQYSLLEQHPAQNRYNNLLAGQFTIRF
jgi:hypothetical protein